MKVRIVRLGGYAPQIDPAPLTDYLLRKFGIDNDVEILDDPTPPETAPVSNRSFSGSVELNNDYKLYTKYKAGCDWLILVWDAQGKPSVTVTATYPDGVIVTSMSLLEASDFLRQASHEVYHGFWKFLGLESLDTMDVQLLDESVSHEHDVENPAGNRERNLAALQPYRWRIRARYGVPQAPIPPQGSNALISAAKTLIGLLMGAISEKEVAAPYGLHNIIHTFGNATDPGFQAKNIIGAKLPYPLRYMGVQMKEIRCHRLVAPNIINALSELETLGLRAHVQNFSGSYNFRPQTDSAKLSTHAFGIAFDFEAEQYPRGGSARFPQAVVDVFARHGFTNGAEFPVPDAMHFQCATGY